MLGDHRSSVAKALSLLKAFSPQDGDGVGMSELARRAKLSKTTAHRLLATLVEYEAVIRYGDNYRPGPLLTGSPEVSVTPQGQVISELLTPFLSALFERTRCTVQLAYIHGTNVAYANKLFSMKTTQSPSRIGGQVPAYATGVGKAMLAWRPELAERVIAGGLRPRTSNTITSPMKLRAELDDVRRLGVAYDREEIALGLVCVAAPIFGHSNEPVAAMSVSIPSSEAATLEQHVPILRRICSAATKTYLNATSR